MAKSKKKVINWHSYRMYALFILGFVIAGLTAVQGDSNLSSQSANIVTLITVLGGIEHYLQGNS